jgi:hypothetical protein
VPNLRGGGGLIFDETAIITAPPTSPHPVKIHSKVFILQIIDRAGTRKRSVCREHAAAFEGKVCPKCAASRRREKLFMLKVEKARQFLAEQRKQA